MKRGVPLKPTINVKDLIPKFVISYTGRIASDLLFDRYSLKIWKNLIKKVANKNSKFDEALIDELSNRSRGMKRLLFAQFHSSEILTIKRITLTVGMDALSCWELKSNEQSIIQFSQALLRQWYKELIENKFLKECFEYKTGKTIHSLREELEKEKSDDEILLILESPTRLNEEYFKTYSSGKKHDEKIRVYYPENYILDMASGKYVDISVDSFDLFQLGFFKVGYDYELLDDNSNKKAHLRCAAISKDGRREIAEFSKGEKFGLIEDMENKVIWRL